jgi:hypothetical protein
MHNAPDSIFRTLTDPTRRMALYGVFRRDRFDALENLLNRMDQ